MTVSCSLIISELAAVTETLQSTIRIIFSLLMYRRVPIEYRLERAMCGVTMRAAPRGAAEYFTFYDSPDMAAAVRLLLRTITGGVSTSQRAAIS